MTSQIAAITDYSAARAGSQIAGLAAVFGSGASATADPLRTGSDIRAAGSAPTQEFEHWSEVAEMTDSTWETHEKALRVTWVIPMRLWLGQVDLGDLRAKAQPFFPLYLSAFQGDPTLGGWAAMSRVQSMDLGSDAPRGPGQARWGFLRVFLEVEEIVDPGAEVS